MILITGSTGFIGRHVLQALQARGEPVRVLLNAPRIRQLHAIGGPLPEIIEGNVLDEEALFRAVSGVHAVIHLENALWWGRARDLERVELNGTRNLITAARAARVGRVITLSQLGATPASAFPLLRTKGAVEEIIRGSGLAYTILRSGVVFGPQDAFINHIAMQLSATPLLFLMPGRGEVVLHPIFIADLVQAVLGTLDRLDTVDKVIEIGGPEYITLEDLIRTIMRVTGRGRLVLGVPPYLLRWLTRMYARLLPRALMTEQWMDILAANRTARIGTLFQTYEIRPQRLEDTLLTYLRGKPLRRELLRYSLRRRPHVL